MIKPSFDDELEKIYQVFPPLLFLFFFLPFSTQNLTLHFQEKEELKDEITKIELNVKQQLNLKSFACQRNTQFGHFFKLSKKDEQQLRKMTCRAAQGYVTCQISKEGIKFKTKDLISLSEEYEKATETYNTRQSSLIEKLIEVAQGFLTFLLFLAFPLLTPSFLFQTFFRLR